MTEAIISYFENNPIKQLQRFNLAFVPLLILSLLGQIAVVWTQLDYIRGGYFDFVMYHSAARLVWDGKGADLYDLALQKDYQKGSRAEPQIRALPFNHLPYELLPLLPLANFSFPVAHVIWSAANFLLLLLTLFRLMPFVEASQRKLSCLMLFAFFPTLTALKMGQDSVITTYLLTETFVSLKHERYHRAGSLLALGLYKPQFILPIAGLLVWQRRWSAVLGFLLTVLALAITCLAMVGWQGLLGLLSLWLPMIDRGNSSWPELMLNLRGLVHMTLGLGGITSATNLCTLVLSVAMYLLTLRFWSPKVDESVGLIELRFSLALVMTALVSFHLYSYDGTLLVIPLILTFNHFLAVRRSFAKPRWIFLLLLIVMFLPLLPNVLLSEAMLAWWALWIPALFWVIAAELRHESACSAPPG